MLLPQFVIFPQGANPNTQTVKEVPKIFWTFKVSGNASTLEKASKVS